MATRLLFLLFLTSSVSFAQTDSVIVTGRVRNLTSRLYRESPTVLVSRNNILQASRELIRPAPLNVDGTFRVALPLIYPQEEMYFTYGRIATPFLAAPGTLRIDLNADSLFTAAVPFQFGGVNAQINTQFARYKAFEAAYPDKPDNRRLSESVNNLTGNSAVFRYVFTAYQEPLKAFAAKEKLFPLLNTWVSGVNRYNAASFVYDKVTYEDEQLPVSLDDSLRPPSDRILTAARASAMNRFGAYATQQNARLQSSRQENGLSVRSLSSLLLRYGQNLTETERTRLQEYTTQNTARASDLRFFNDLIKRSNDTIQRLASYENMIRRGKEQFDSVAVQYLTAYWLANALPGLTLNFTKLLYSYARPQVKDLYLRQSLDELYRLEVQDSTRIRAAVQTFEKAGSKLSNTEVSTGVFINRDSQGNGSALFDQITTANRGKVIYVLLANPADENGRQAALDAQRLRNAYRSRDIALLYVPVTNEPKFWVEFSTKNNLVGDHLLLTTGQLSDILQRLRANDTMTAAVINRTGKIVKRNAPLPGAFEDVRKQIDKNL